MELSEKERAFIRVAIKEFSDTLRSEERYTWGLTHPLTEEEYTELTKKMGFPYSMQAAQKLWPREI